jgi:hypothetical protein
MSMVIRQLVIDLAGLARVRQTGGHLFDQTCLLVVALFGADSRIAPPLLEPRVWSNNNATGRFSSSVNKTHSAAVNQSSEGLFCAVSVV